MAAVLLCLTAGCSAPEAEPSATPTLAAAEARALEQRVLDQRARALRTGDLELFLRSVDRTDPQLVERQRRYFDNLTQLPLQRLRYRVLPRLWPSRSETGRWGEPVRVPEVQLSFQLEGYDATPVRRVVGFAFSYRGKRPVIVSDVDSSGSPLVRGGTDPWDLAEISVRERDGVLGVFDPATVRGAATVMRVVRRGIEELRSALPFAWSERVVVYLLADTRVLASFADVPGGTLAQLGAMTFPQHSSPARDEVASIRMLLMPSSVRAGQPFLSRITRHELSHVAIGARDDGAPAWFCEGLAEYLAARTLPPADRIIATPALARAATHRGGMPPTARFNGRDQAWHYALSWMAVDHLAREQGEDVLWRLADALHDSGSGTSDAEQDAVLREVIGYDSRELGRRAAARIRAIYG